jgi:hypothetical protein
MRTIGEDGGDEGRGLGADGFRPLDQARRRPLEMMLVGLGHVRGIGAVAARRGIAKIREILRQKWAGAGSPAHRSRSAIYVFTIPILAFTMSDPGVHVAPIAAFTMD